MKPSRHLLDPELRAPLASLSSAALEISELPRVRAEIEASVRALRSRPSDPALQRSEQLVPGPPDAPELRVQLFRPVDAVGPLPALLWIHGGGFVAGTPDWDFPLEAIAKALPALVVAVDYRLAPETKFPGAIEDCHAALQWLHDEAQALGVDRSRIAIGGVSAGGCLAAALTLLARDRGSVPICFQLLLQPKLDDRTCLLAQRSHPGAGEFVWTAANNAFSWSCMLEDAPGSDVVSQYAAPARAESFEGLPPCFLSVGTLDLFLHEDIEYGRHLVHAGVPVELHVYPGAYHGFQLIAPTSRLARMHERDILCALRNALHPVLQECAA
jgi:acetyl esterase/lipase